MSLAHAYSEEVVFVEDHPSKHFLKLGDSHYQCSTGCLHRSYLRFTSAQKRGDADNPFTSDQADFQPSAVFQVSQKRNNARWSESKRGRSYRQAEKSTSPSLKETTLKCGAEQFVLFQRKSGLTVDYR